VLCAVILGNTSAALAAVGSSTGTGAAGASASDSEASPVSVGASVTSLPGSPGPGPRLGWQSSDGPQTLPVRFSFGTTESCSHAMQWFTCNATVSSPPCLQLYQTALDNVVLCSNDPQYLTVSSSSTSLDFAYTVRQPEAAAALSVD